MSPLLKALLIFILIFTTKYCLCQCTALDIINYRKTAIVFGEKGYNDKAALKNTTNDARDISDSLRSVGFDVEVYYDTRLKQMEQLLENWFQKLKEYDVALFYFSGHGSQVSDLNYLYPIDANPKSLSDLRDQTYLANNVVERLSDTNLKCGIIILDACRSNPFTRSWTRNSNEGGLSSMVGRGTFIGFAAEPGKVALDGNERNGTYTKAILKYITKPNLSIDQIFNRVNDEVRRDTKGEQVPYKLSSLNSEFCFNIPYRRTDSLRKKNFYFLQPNSSIILSPNEDEVFVADKDSNRILIRSLNSTSSKYYFENFIKPFKLISGNKFVYVIDSINKRLFIVDPINKLIKSQVEFKFTPLGFSIPANEKRAYVLQVDSISKSIFSIVDLQTLKIEKSVSLKRYANSIIISPNNSALYISTHYRDTSVLIKYDIKSFKILDSVKSTTALTVLGTSTDGRSLFLNAQKDNPAEEQLLIANARTMSFTDTIDIPANSLTFSYDSNYVFALGNNTINVIRLKDKLLTNKIPFATVPAGLAVSINYTSYAWLPKEDRVFVKDLKAVLESAETLTPEEKYQNFLKQQRSKYSNSDKDKATELFQFFDHRLVNDILSIKRELGASFTYFSKDENNYDKRDFIELTFKRNAGIKSAFDDKKFISPTFLIKLSGNKFAFSITDPYERSNTISKEFPLAKIEDLQKYSDEFSKMIKQFFYDRIERLK